MGEDEKPLIGARKSGRPSLADLRLVRLAARKGWDIPPAARTLALQRMVQILEDDASAPRAWLGVQRALLACDRAELQAIDTESTVQARDGAARIARETWHREKTGGGGEMTLSALTGEAEKRALAHIAERERQDREPSKPEPQRPRVESPPPAAVNPEADFWK